MKISKQQLKKLVESLIEEQMDDPINSGYPKVYEAVLDSFTDFEKKLKVYYKLTPDAHKSKIIEIFRILRAIENLLLDG